jgi:hypothetical protein
MDNDEKIEAIIKFVSSFPESTASRSILKRHYIKNKDYESSQALAGELKEILKKEEKDELNFCYYLIK